MTVGAKRLGAFALAAVIVAANGCVLVVGSSSFGGTCHFQGDTTSPCGECIAKSCQAAVNSCCNDHACSGVLSSLDRCGLTSVCTLDDPSGGSSGTADALRACVASSCNGVCVAFSTGGDAGGGGREGGTGGSGSATCDQIGTDDCYCSYAGPGAGNGTVCGPTSVENAVCCGDIDWPDRELHCSCQRFACAATTNGGCDCYVGKSGNLDSCTGDYCCAFGGSCQCGPDPCSSVDTQVPSCTADVAGCSGSSEQRKASCAP